MDNLYYILTIDFSLVELAPILSELSEAYSYDGIEEFSLDESQVDAILGKRAYSGGDIPQAILDEVNEKSSGDSIKIYFYGASCKERSSCFKNELLNRYNIESSLSEEAVQDWNTEWRRHYRPIEINDEFKIVPEWNAEICRKGDVLIYPGMGFGTGSHETTYLCLKLFLQTQDRLVTIAKKILDFGCGSGILGITAEKRYGADVTYVDIDDSALENCRQNLKLNNIPIKNENILKRNKFFPNNEFDIIFANILLDALVLEKNTIINSLNNGGILIASGILKEQIDEFLDNYPEFIHKTTEIQNDWAALVMELK